ncbi:MAG: hypothetical protein K2O18_19935, partial [Oscillospiraceae bacterium]|nr:hypothetical protein [Oscillospiraceae bacterium]
MTRVQFLNDLYKRISSLPEDQAEQHLTYYAEMLADRIEEGMSEEEAVASMEPVDVIVQRIFEDSPPPEQPAIQSPVYPDLPETGGSRFSKVPDMPRKRASISRIILWVIAIVVAIGAAGNKIRQYRHMIPDIPYVHETAVDYSSSPVTEVELVPAEDCGSMWEEADNLYSFGPDGIEINGTQIGPEGIFSEQEGIEITGGGIIHNPLSVSSRYAVLNDTYRTLDASSVEINWTSGAVDVCYWGGDTIEFQEYSDELLPESQKLEYWVEDYTLKINDRVPGDKGLIVYIPAGFCSQLFVDTTSADVTLSGLRYLGSASVYTSSGDIGVYN